MERDTERMAETKTGYLKVQRESALLLNFDSKNNGDD